MNTWLETVSSFLGCDIARLNPNIVYIGTVCFLALIICAFAYVLGRSGKR